MADAIPYPTPSSPDAPESLDNSPGAHNSINIIGGVGDLFTIDDTTKITVVFDGSGSMDDVLASLQEMQSTLLQPLLLPYYGFDEAAYDANVTVEENNSEEFLKWLSGADGIGTPGAKQIYLIFVDESQGDYTDSSTPGPTATGLSDITDLRTFLAGRVSEDYRGVVFHVNSDFGGAVAQLEAMLEHVINGTSPYDSDGENLADYAGDGLVAAVLDVADDGDAEYYADLVRDALSRLNVAIPPPGSLTNTPTAPADAPDALTNSPASAADAPDALTNEAAAQASAPDALTNEAAAQADAPDALTNEAAAQASAPDALTNNPASAADAPDALTNEAAAPAYAPSALTNSPVSAADAPDALTNEAAAPADAPDALTNPVASSPAGALSVPQSGDWIFQNGLWDDDDIWNDAASWPAA